MTVRYERSGVAAILTLDQPDRLNAVSEEMLDALLTALDRAEADTVRAVMITGAGRAFCAGGTLASPLPDDAGAILATHLNPVLRRLVALPMPVLALVNGAAVGAGLSIALAADIVIAARSASFVAAFIRVGLVPDGGLTWLLSRIVGYHRAMAIMMLGETLSSEQALAMGLVWSVVDDADLASAGRAMLDRLARGPTLALAAVRRLGREALDSDFAAALDAERDAQRIAGRTADFQEGVAAFLNRRAATFTGR